MLFAMFSVVVHVLIVTSSCTLASYIKILSVNSTYNSDYGILNITLMAHDKLNIWLETRYQLNNSWLNIHAQSVRYGSGQLNSHFNRTDNVCNMSAQATSKDPVLKIMYGGTFMNKKNKGFIGCPIVPVPIRILN